MESRCAPSDAGGVLRRGLADAGCRRVFSRHLVYRHALAVSADGQTLVMAFTTGAVWASADAAESWHTIARDLPPVAAVWFVG